MTRRYLAFVRAYLPLLATVAVSLTVAVSFMAGRLTAPTAPHYDPPPAAARADADIRAWAGDQGDVTLFRRNAVVFNYTIGLNRYMARQASAWYVLSPRGTWHLAGVQWFTRWTE